MGEKKPKLTAKQELFVKEYLVDLNATQAAIRSGYSKKTANRIGTENLSKPVIQDAVQAEMDKRNKRVEIDADWVLEQAVRMFKKTAEEDPSCSAKFLKMVGDHVNIEAFNLTKKHELSGKDGEPIEVDTTWRIEVAK